MTLPGTWGKQPENYLHVIDPDHSATRGGFLTPTYPGCSRASDWDRLLRLEGADPINNQVRFSQVESAQPGLNAVELIKS